ncbi:hypothetical protein PR202_ga21865 [Eleusine coracana subsp. coracana]|uniref:Retrotransposon gag domain-containing protein n=1 Tax=Eleusine coracana subsp. coracana TaxID=191504 RepID=A0AAV5D1W3_ELECO|nr:hypothetical protein PR202_ga21865 [Eleusine coracana subsp. coracana]
MMESQQQQAEFMREVAQQNLATRNARGHHDGAPQNSSYSDFLATRPPTFSSTTEPMEAENFLRMLESKFGLLNCTPMQKTLFAAQQLHGAAGAWWANHDRLNLNMGGTFAEFVNNAIVAEDGYRRVMAERKRSASAMGPSNGPPQKFRMVYTTPSGQRYRSAPVPAPVVRLPPPAQQRTPVPRPQQSQGGFRQPQRLVL